MRLATGALLGLLAGAALLLAPGCARTPAPGSAPPREAVQVWTFDAGDGAATLVRVPGGDTLLVDGGSVATGALVGRWLPRLGLGLPDHVVVTRMDAAHLGGVVRLLSGRDGLPGTDDDPALAGARLDPGPDTACARLECRGYALLARGTAARAGDTVDLGGGVTARVERVAEGALDLTLRHGAVSFAVPGAPGAGDGGREGRQGGAEAGVVRVARVAGIPPPGGPVAAELVLATGPCAGAALAAAGAEARVLRVPPAAWEEGCAPGAPVPEARGVVLLLSDGRGAEVRPLKLDGAPAGEALKLPPDGSLSE